MRGEYKHINPPGKLVFTERYDHPALGPSEDLTTVTFEESEGVTKLTVTSLCETRLHREGHIASGAVAGAAQSFDKLDQLLASIK